MGVELATKHCPACGVETLRGDKYSCDSSTLTIHDNEVWHRQCLYSRNSAEIRSRMLSRPVVRISAEWLADIEKNTPPDERPDISLELAADLRECRVALYKLVQVASARTDWKPSTWEFIEECNALAMAGGKAAP